VAERFIHPLLIIHQTIHPSTAHHSSIDRSLIHSHMSITHAHTHAATAASFVAAVAVGRPLAVVVAGRSSRRRHHRSRRSSSATHIAGRSSSTPLIVDVVGCSSSAPPTSCYTPTTAQLHHHFTRTGGNPRQGENSWLPPCSLLDVFLLHHMSQVVLVFYVAPYSTPSLVSWDLASLVDTNHG
jgi:hypothetical protein